MSLSTVAEPSKVQAAPVPPAPRVDTGLPALALIANFHRLSCDVAIKGSAATSSRVWLPRRRLSSAPSRRRGRSGPWGDGIGQRSGEAGDDGRPGRRDHQRSRASGMTPSKRARWGERYCGLRLGSHLGSSQRAKPVARLVASKYLSEPRHAGRDAQRTNRVSRLGRASRHRTASRGTRSGPGGRQRGVRRHHRTEPVIEPARASAPSPVDEGEGTP